MTRSEELERQAYAADEKGHDIYIQRHHEYDVVEYIEIDGEEIYNDEYVDEVKEQYWLEDSYRVAEQVLHS